MSTKLLKRGVAVSTFLVLWALHVVAMQPAREGPVPKRCWQGGTCRLAAFVGRK